MGVFDLNLVKSNKQVLFCDGICVRESFDDPTERVKIIEITECTTTFTRLKGCAGDYKEGVWGAQSGEIKNL